MYLKFNLFQIFVITLDPLINPTQTISRIPIKENQTFEWFDSLVKKHDNSEVKGEPNTWVKISKFINKKACERKSK